VDCPCSTKFCFLDVPSARRTVDQLCSCSASCNRPRAFGRHIRSLKSRTMNRGGSRIDMEKADTKVAVLLFASLSRLVLGLGVGTACPQDEGTQASPCVAACSDLFRWYFAYGNLRILFPSTSIKQQKELAVNLGLPKCLRWPAWIGRLLLTW
jgi:hypothetical protein